jgi:hypothetical protein
VHFHISEGVALSSGDTIATMTLDESDKGVSAELFRGSLVISNSFAALQGSLHPHVAARAAISKLERVLDG